MNNARAEQRQLAHMLARGAQHMDAMDWLRLLVVLDVRSQQPADLLKAVADVLKAHHDDVQRERFARLAEVNGR